MKKRSRPRTALAALALGRRAAGGLAVLVAVLTVIAGLAPVATAWLGKLIIDGLTGVTPVAPERLVWLAASAAIVTGLGILLGYTAGYLNMRMETAIVHHAQETMYVRVSQFAGLRRFEDPAFADQLRLAEDSARETPSVLAMFLVNSVRSLVGVSTFVGVLLAVWPPMALLVLVVATFAVFSQLALARRQAGLAQAIMATQRRQLSYQNLLTDLRSAKELRLFGLAELFRGRMLTAMRTAATAELRLHRRAATSQSLLGGLGSLALALGSGVVVLEVAHGGLTPGDFVLFLAAAAAVQGAIFGMISNLRDAARCTRLFGHYLDVLEAPADMADGSLDPGPLQTGIRFHDVWFRYDPDGPWILRGVNLFIPAGKSFGLVGRNGAGKSSLVKLICRFYEVERGRITWDGVEIGQFSIAALRRRIGVTFQDFQVYDLSVAENIGIGDLDAFNDRERISAAARTAGLADVVEALPSKYDTLLSRVFFDDGSGQPGVQLSGGENQRLALARALIRESAELLILDEPSSGLDPAAEHALAETIRRRGSGHTSLHISHRLGSLRDADRIAVLVDGVVAETGTHDELMTAQGAYAELFTLQAANYQDDRPEPAEEIREMVISVPIGMRIG